MLQNLQFGIIVFVYGAGSDYIKLDKTSVIPYKLKTFIENARFLNNIIWILFYTVSDCIVLHMGFSHVINNNLMLFSSAELMN